MMWIFNTVVGSFWGRAVGVALLAWGALTANNVWQRSVGETRGINKVVTKSNEVAKDRDEKIRKIRSRIKPGTAFKRLQSEYPGTD